MVLVGDAALHLLLYNISGYMGLCYPLHDDRYSPKGWEKYFRPLSETCTDRRGNSTAAWDDGKLATSMGVINKFSKEGHDFQPKKNFLCFSQKKM